MSEVEMRDMNRETREENRGNNAARGPVDYGKLFTDTTRERRCAT